MNPQSALKLLQEKRQLLTKRQASLMEEDPFADPERLNDNASIDTEAAEQFGHERVSAMVTEIKAELIRIDGAILKIKSGSWGKCDACGKNIPLRRLALDPSINLCVACLEADTVYP